MCYNTYRLSHFQTPFLALIYIFLFFSFTGCTESVNKINYVSKDATALEALNPNDNIGSMQNKSAQELTNAGFAFLDNNNLKIAEVHFLTAIEKDPKMAEAFIGLGRTDMLKGDYSGALNAFERAKQLKPDSLPALIGETRAYRSEGKLDAAIKQVNAAMMIDPDNIDVLKELALIYDLMGKENLSAPLYIEIVNKVPDDASSHNNLGLNCMVRGEYSQAIQSFFQAIELDRNNARIKNNLATAYLLNGDEADAINIFTATVGEAEAYNNIGYLYMTQGYFDKAEQALNKAMQVNPRYYVRAQENLDTLKEMRRKAMSSQQ